MPKLEIKIIKGHRYLYIADSVKVNAKKLTITFYVGRLEKTSLDGFTKKVGEFELIKLKKYTDYRLKKHRCDVLDPPRALNLEFLAYGYQQLREHYADEFGRYQEAVFVKYAQGTTAIEGNTITTRQARELLKHNVTPSGKTLREIHELINFRDLQTYLHGYKGDVSERLIKQMHAIIERNISDIVGAYRQIQVWIEKADYVPPPPFEIPTLMKELIAWYRKNKGRLHPFELGIRLHTKFVTIHPFTNGNGRIGRALLNFVLQKNGYPTLILDLGDRERYLDAVAEGNDEKYDPIITFMYDMYLSQHRQITEAIIQKIKEKEVKAFPSHDELIKEFMRMKGVAPQNKK
ncbi:MAG: Fic family protein [Candidatus Methanospirareceae archaeon]